MGVEAAVRSEDPQRGAVVNVFAAAEGVNQRVFFSKVRQHTKLDLRVVRRDEHEPGIRDERAPDFSPEVGADRNVLQVPVAAAQPAGRGHGLVERRMHARCSRVHELRQGVDVRALQFHQRAPLEDQLRKLVCERQILEHVDRGRRHLGLARPLGGWELQLVEQDDRELLRRVDVERFSSQLEDFALRDASSASMRVDWLASAGRSIARRNARCPRVPARAAAPGRGTTPRPHPRAVARAAVLRAAKPDPRALREVQQCGGGQMRQRNRLLPRAADVILRERLVPKVLERNLLDGMARPCRIEHVARQHRVELEPAEGDPLVPEHHQIELEVVANFRDRGALETSFSAATAARGLRADGSSSAVCPIGSTARGAHR